MNFYQIILAIFFALLQIQQSFAAARQPKKPLDYPEPHANNPGK
jgi:hypothetical protein